MVFLKMTLPTLANQLVTRVGSAADWAHHVPAQGTLTRNTGTGASMGQG